MGDIHDLKNTAVAVFDSKGDAGQAIESLRAAGHPYEVIQGEEGSEHLDPHGEGGAWATLKRLASSLGDEKRVLEKLDREVRSGAIVISVDIEGDGASGAVTILRDHGGRFIWRFGEWAFTPIEV